VSDRDDEHYEPDHDPPSRTPLLFLLAFFLILFFAIFPPKGPKVDLYQLPEKTNKVSDVMELANREVKNPVSAKKLLVLQESIYSDGDMPLIQEDLLEDEYKQVITQDFSIVIDHLLTKKYLERIVSYLEKQSGEIWGERKTKLYLYDDRYVGLKNSVFSLSGGTIFFGTSIFLNVQNEAEAAAVLSHERGHIVLRHSALRRKVTKGITFFEQKFAKVNDLEGQKILLLAKVKILGFWDIDGELHKIQEIQADNVGQLILRKCGYDDLASAKFLSKLAKLYFTDQMVLENMDNRTAYMKENSAVFRLATGYEGKNFIVSFPRELKEVQEDLKNYLNRP